LLYGLEGVGKRSLAATLAANRMALAQSVLWLIERAAPFPSLAEQVIRAYDLGGAAKPKEAAQTLLQEHSPLIILQSQDLRSTAEFIGQVAAYRASVLALHTAAAEGPWQTFRLPPLDESQSRQVFGLIAGEQHLSHPDSIPLLDYLKGHPFSLRLVASQIAQGHSQLAELRAARPPPNPDPHQAALGAIDLAYSSLDKPAQGLLLVMGASFAPRLSIELLQDLLGTSAPHLAQVLSGRGFIQARYQGGKLYYELHPLMADFARRRLAENDRLEEAQARMVKALIQFCRQTSSPGQAPILELELENILYAARHCLLQQDWDSLEQFVHALEGLSLFLPAGAHQQELDYLRRALGRGTGPLSISPPPQDLAAVLEPGPQAETMILTGTVIDTEDKADEEDTKPNRPAGLILSPAASTALTTEAQVWLLSLGEALVRHDRGEVARLSLLLGQHHLAGGEAASALYYFQQAERHYQALGNLQALAATLEILTEQSLLYYGPQVALDYGRQGLNMARQLGDDPARCRFLRLLGDIFLALYNPQTALESYKRAIKLARLLGQEETMGVLLAKLAAIYMDQAQFREASVALGQAVKTFEQLGRRDLMGRALGNLGTALGQLGRWREAGQRHAAALKLAREAGDKDEERFQLHNLAYVAEIEGYTEWAVHYLRQALYLALLAEDEAAIGDFCYDLARLLAGIPESTAQAMILINAALSYQAQSPDLHRWLKECRVRLRQRERNGLPIEPAETDLLLYAGEVYPHV
jgi:tetratricopeptide (TPR) repeat protein